MPRSGAGATGGGSRAGEPVGAKMSTYDVEPWHDLYVMVGGAAAALAGLIFVAVSVNHIQILARAHLTNLATRALMRCATGAGPGGRRS